MKDNKCINKFRKNKDGWNLTIATGSIFSCTCEQMVSHLLPALAFEFKGLKVKVIPDNGDE